MDGFVFVDKPEGLSSFVLSAKVRRIFGEKKSGHTGTLDPAATGVMVVALSGATRFIELIPEGKKAYRAKFRLGETTDTLDSTGKVLSRVPSSVTEEELKAALEPFFGESMQLPPMYSALKKDGVRLYELARRGESIEREKRKIEIFELSLLAFDEESQSGEIFVSCSAGTYIRSLVSDIGEALSCGAVMTELRRTAANSVPIEKCFSLSRLEELREKGELETAIVPIADFLSFPRIFVSENQAKRFSNGGELFLKRLSLPCDGGLFSIFSPEKEFLGVGLADREDGLLKARKIMSKPN